MSAREKALNIIEYFTDEQINAFILMFGDNTTGDGQPNEETMAALREVRDMKREPGKYKGYDDVDKMFEELLA
ncbi:MAG: hypothetical protein NC078_05795 [Ruminococcus sp.]|nr:hypothetical protein [Ruminococcus sp.]